MHAADAATRQALDFHSEQLKPGVMLQVKDLHKQGFKEILLLGQNVKSLMQTPAQSLGLPSKEAAPTTPGKRNTVI